MLPYAGCEELWCQAAARLAKAGHNVEANVCYVPWPSAKMDELAANGCRIVVRPVRTSIRAAPQLVLKRLRKVALRPAETMPGFRQTKQWLRQFRPDLVLISQNFQTQGTQWMQICRQLGLPYAIVVQAVSEADWPTDEEAGALRDGFSDAEQTYFVSQNNLELLRDQLNLPLSRSKVVRNPYTVPAAMAAPHWPDTTNGWKLACVARLHPRSKGQDLLLHVLAQEKWRKRPISVTLFGEGPNKNNLVRLIELLGLTSVEFGGFNSDIQSLWSDYHALVLPSRYEGLPLALVEATLCSRMAIVTDVAGNAEVVEDDVTGFVASAATVGALDEAMERAWSRRDEWQAIGGRAAEHTRKIIPSDPAQVFANELLDLALAVGRTRGENPGARAVRPRHPKYREG